MNEVRKWWRSINLEGVTKVYQVVLASDCDAALARETALQGELDAANGCLEEWRRSNLGKTLLENVALQQRLTDAEKRCGELESAAREMLRIAGIAKQGSNAYNRAIINLNAALKPVEGAQS